MKIAEIIRRNGFWYSLAILFNRLIPGWLFRYRNFVIYEMNVEEEVPSDWRALLNRELCQAASTAPSATRVRWCESVSDYEAVERLTYFRRPFSAVNLTACSAEVNGRLAGGFWAAAEQFDEQELGLRLKLGTTQAWLFAALVHKDMRRMGIHSEMLRFMVSELTTLGFNEIFVAVNPTNIGSNRIHSRHARSLAGRVWVVRFLSITCCFVRGRVQVDRWFRFNVRRNPIELRFPSSVPKIPMERPSAVRASSG